MSSTKQRVIDQWLINPREGAQRFFIGEHIKTEHMAWMLATRVEPSHLGGVPGLYFAMSDVGAARVKVHGPNGTSLFVTASQDFVRRKYPALEVLDVEPARAGCARVVSAGRATVLSVRLGGECARRAYCHWCEEESPASVDEAASSDDDVSSSSGSSCCSAPASPSTLCYLMSIDSTHRLVLVDCRSDQPSLLSAHPHLRLSCPRHPPSVVVHLSDAATCASAPYARWVASLPAVAQHVYAHSQQQQPPLAASDARLAHLGSALPRLFPAAAIASASSRPAQLRSGSIDANALDLDSWPRLAMLGTGAAKPSALRGLSAAQLWTSASTSVLLDCGEDTLGQMARLYAGDVTAAVASIQLVWVSHGHLDHHGGLLALLAARPGLLVAGPAQLGRFLERVSADCRFVHCAEVRGLSEGFSKLTLAAAMQVHRTLPWVSALPARHCFDAFSVCLDLPAVRLVYSGDTEYNPELGRRWAGDGAKPLVLVHEATFGDDDWAQARAKRHAVVADAAQCGKDLGATVIVLTHLSQRHAASGLPLADLERATRPGVCLVQAEDCMVLPLLGNLGGGLVGVFEP